MEKSSKPSECRISLKIVSDRLSLAGISDCLGLACETRLSVDKGMRDPVLGMTTPVTKWVFPLSRTNLPLDVAVDTAFNAVKTLKVKWDELANLRQMGCSTSVDCVLFFRGGSSTLVFRREWFNRLSDMGIELEVSVYGTC